MLVNHIANSQVRSRGRQHTISLPDFRAGLAVITRVVTNLVHFVRAMALVEIRVQGDTVTLTHPSGTAVAMRADGNLDTTVTRNLQQKTSGVLLLNCDPEDDRFTSFDQIKNAFPWRYNQQAPETNLLDLRDWQDRHAG